MVYTLHCSHLCTHFDLSFLQSLEQDIELPMHLQVIQLTKVLQI